ncbi:MAG: cob(I)yrinic acid a,c-diamide adenosyltransferase [Spirochaetales bacterium]|nr:cob(I)yrinic acid a,c-diamide adenosyltransferase [Spirochaetales bacterium]
MSRGFLIVYTGNGKGKTTAAFGLALRCLGHKKKVGVVQFIKSRETSGEVRALKKFAGLVDIRVTGTGFVTNEEDRARNIPVAQKAWALARDMILKSHYDMVILDEFTHLLDLNLLDGSEVGAFLDSRPPQMHIVITGRHACPEILDRADLVTEMNEVRHPFTKGIKAQKGIEY